MTERVLPFDDYLDLYQTFSWSFRVLPDVVRHDALEQFRGIGGYPVSFEDLRGSYLKVMEDALAASVALGNYRLDPASYLSRFLRAARECDPVTVPEGLNILHNFE